MPTLMLSGLVLLSCVGCAGTLTTRMIPQDESHVVGGPDKTSAWCGAYPYLAVVADVDLLLEGGGEVARVGDASNTEKSASFGAGAGAAVFALLSIPLDIVFDTVLLPVDLVAWASGYGKVMPTPVSAPQPQG